MKGIVTDCLQELVVSSYGAEAWREIARRAGVAGDRTFQIDEDVPEEQAMALFAKTCEVGQLSFEQACDAFGAYWVGTYVPRRYPEFYEGVRSTKDFLLRLDAVHVAMRQRLPGARPPLHDYAWRDESTLVMGYRSARGLMPLFVAAVRGAAKHFGDSLGVRELDPEHVEITFG